MIIRLPFIKNPCDNCIATPICKEMNCSLENEYYNGIKDFLIFISKIVIAFLWVVLTIQIVGWIWNGTPPKDIIYPLVFLNLTSIICNVYMILLPKIAKQNYRKRRWKYDTAEHISMSSSSTSTSSTSRPKKP